MIATALLIVLAQTPGFDAGVPTPPPAPPAAEQTLLPATPLEAPAAAEAPAPPSLEERLAKLEEELAATLAKLNATDKRVEWLRKLPVHFSGYLDFGFFFVEGDGSGVRQDLTHQVKRYQGQILDSWVLVGDPLSTTINSRGDVADTGASRAIRFDPIASGGRPTFLVNAANLALQADITDGLTVYSSVDLLIRDRNVSNPAASVGDYFDVKLAYAHYQLGFDWAHFDVYAGKIDSVLGVEYRRQDSDTRLTVTPSLICRYTCGRPVGLRANGAFLDDRLGVSVSVTNGSNVIDGFPFSNDAVDFNRFKTVSGKLAWRFPIDKGVEIGVSGAYGPQDRQPDDSVMQWHYGFHLLATIRDFEGAAEFVTGRALGKSTPVDGTCGAAPCLFYRGMYAQLGWHATNWLVPYARFDWRAAEHRLGFQYAYESYVVRTTVGLRLQPLDHFILKAEYTVNTETWPFDFPDNVFTSSLVAYF